MSISFIKEVNKQYKQSLFYKERPNSIKKHCFECGNIIFPVKMNGRQDTKELPDVWVIPNFCVVDMY